VGDFSLELKKLKIILKDDIIRLRQHIHAKYPHYDSNKRASILIKSISSIIDEYLVDIPPNYRKAIKEDLLHNKLLNNQEGIFLFDVLETCVSLEVKDEDFLDSLCTLINTRVNTSVNKEDILEYQENNYHKVIPQDISIESDLTLQTLVSPKENSQGHTLEDLGINYTSKDFFQKTKLKYIFLLTAVSFVSIMVLTGLSKGDTEEPFIDIEPVIVYQYDHLPQHFYYKDIDEEKLKLYLNTRNSLLKEEPYFSAIINVSKEFELNPLILFAIAGHEQGFVPKDHPSALKIVNNPFNVFYSWQNYNTDITDSTKIAARTVINLSRDRPEDIDPFQWINRKYAEDENWWVGIKSIYNRLEREVE